MLTDHQKQILRILDLAGEDALSMTEIGRILECAPGVFQRGLNSLERDGFVMSSSAGRKRMFHLNREHALAIAAASTADDVSQDYRHYLLNQGGMHSAEPTPVYDAAKKKVLIIAGPNGAGKSTFARRFLDDASTGRRFVNADNIAAGISPLDPDGAARQAAKIMISEVERYVSSQKSFAVETTLSGRRYRREIKDWQAAGYCVKIIFLSLPVVELAVERVACRVAQGGHTIPLETIHRRFKRGLENFHGVYKPLCDAWALYDSAGTVPRLLDEGER